MESTQERCIVCGEVKEIIVGNCCGNEKCLQTFDKFSCEKEQDTKEEEEEDDFPEEIIDDIKNLSRKRLKKLACLLELKWSDTEDMTELIVEQAKKDETDLPRDFIKNIDGFNVKQLKLTAYYLGLKWSDEEDMVERIQNRFNETKKEEEKETQGWGCSMM